MQNLDVKKIYTLDETAVNELVERYYTPLVFFARSILGCTLYAEDVVSDAIVKLLVKRPSLKNENAIKTYLYTAVKNRALDYLRKQKREKVLTSTDIENYASELNSDDTQRIIIINALNSIAEQYRQVVYLRFYENLSVDEICKILKKSKKQTYNLLARAKETLSEILKKEGFEDEIE